MVDWWFLPRNFGQVVGTYKGLLQLCECRWGGDCTCIWWGHLNTTCHNRICLNFLHWETVGNEKLVKTTPHALAPCPHTHMPCPHALPSCPHTLPLCPAAVLLWPHALPSRVQRCKGERTQGWEGARARGCKGERAQGQEGTRVRGCKGERAQGREGAKLGQTAWAQGLAPWPPWVQGLAPWTLFVLTKLFDLFAPRGGGEQNTWSNYMGARPAPFVPNEPPSETFTAWFFKM